MLYEIIISHKVQTEKKSKTDKLYYLVKDEEFTAACCKAAADFIERHPGEEFKIIKASESNIREYLKDESVIFGELKYYRCKVEFTIVVDEIKGTEKKDTELYLVPADSNKSANDVCRSCVESMQNFKIKDVKEDKILLIVE